MGGKLEMTAEVSYTLGQTLYGSQYNFTPVVTTGTVVSQCSSPTILSCGNLPTISSETSQLKVTGTYQIDKSSKFVVRYVYQALTASDYFYNGYQYGSTASSLMPTNQSAGTYTDNVVSFGYVHNF
jgi:hypothetical protein